MLKFNKGQRVMDIVTKEIFTVTECNVASTGLYELVNDLGESTVRFSYRLMVCKEPLKIMEKMEIVA